MLKTTKPEQLVSTLAAPLKLSQAEGERLSERLTHPTLSSKAQASADRARELAKRYGLFQDAWPSK